MVKKMKNKKYEEITEKHKPNEHRGKNCLVAFLIGGLIGGLGEILIELYIMWFHISQSQASTYMIITLIFLACLCTALRFFDKWVTFARCGLLIPITGFAHSMQSASLEYKTEGLVYGIGSNAFKLAGTVIVYGVVSAWSFGMIRLLIGGGAV